MAENPHRRVVDATRPAPHEWTTMIEIHATCVSIDGAGLLLRGPSGAGKSDLALRLVDGGAHLVADDRVLLSTDGRGNLMATASAGAPANLAGLIEVRGLGILPVPHIATAPVALLVDLRPGGAAERLPPPSLTDLAGIRLPRLELDPFHASAPAFLRLALRAWREGHPLVPGEAPWQAACGEIAG